MHVETYRRYGPALLRKARRLLRNEDDARDTVQSLFVELIARGEEIPNELPYLYRALTRRCLNAIRDEKNRTRLLERESPALAGPSRIAPDTQALGLAMICRLSDLVEEAVMETLVYRFYDEMGLEEIATTMRVSRKTVQNRLQRASAVLTQLEAERSTP